MATLRCTQCRAAFAHIAYPQGATLQCPHCGGRIAPEHPADSPTYHARRTAASTLVWAIGGMTLCVAAVGAVLWLYLSEFRFVTLIAPDGNTKQIIVQGDVRKLMGQDPEQPADAGEAQGDQPATRSDLKRLENKIEGIAQELRKDQKAPTQAPPVKPAPQTQPAKQRPANQPTVTTSKPMAKDEVSYPALAGVANQALRDDIARRLGSAQRMREIDPDFALQSLADLRLVVDAASLTAEARTPLFALLAQEEAATAKASEELAALRETLRARHAAELAADAMNQDRSPAVASGKFAAWGAKARGRERAAYYLEARSLALQVDFATIDALVSSMTWLSPVDADQTRFEWLKLASAELVHSQTAEPARHAALAQRFLKLSAGYVKVYEFERALAALDLADQHGIHAQSAPLEQTLRQERVALAVRKEEHAKTVPARAKLQTAPEDPDANFVLGRYLCFIENDWKAGLPHLARGSEPNLAAMARDDLAHKTPNQNVDMGDRWWDLAQELFPLARQNVLQRAKRWYMSTGQAEPELRKRALERVEQLAVSGDNPLAGRKASVRPKLLARYGGDAKSELAVADALEWLARTQDPATGAWSLKEKGSTSGAVKENKTAATAMALLAFQGAGHTHHELKYGAKIGKAVNFLLEAQRNDGSLPDEGPHNAMFYTHGLATMAFSELAVMTRDARCIEAARKAAEFGIKTQNRLGGWRYTVGPDGTSTESDSSVTGWMVLGLHTAKLAGAEVPEETFHKVSRYLDLNAGGTPKGSRYGYTGPNEGVTTEATTAEGLLCRQYLGWEQNDPRLSNGADFFLTRLPNWNERNVYYWYHATQVLYNLEGPRWNLWNKATRDLLVQHQQRSGPERGSWEPRGDRWGSEAGRLFTTCFSVYILEVYYRRLPLHAESPL